MCFQKEHDLISNDLAKVTSRFQEEYGGGNQSSRSVPEEDSKSIDVVSNPKKRKLSGTSSSSSSSNKASAAGAGTDAMLDDSLRQGVMRTQVKKLESLSYFIAIRVMFPLNYPPDEPSGDAL